MAEDHTLEVRLEVDTGLRRTGVPLDEAVGLAVEIEAMGNLDLTGINTTAVLFWAGPRHWSWKRPASKRGTSGLPGRHAEGAGYKG